MRTRTNAGDCFEAFTLLTQQEITGAAAIKLNTNSNGSADFPLMGEGSSYIRGTRVRRVGTYSLLVCDVQLWLGVRLQLILLKSCVDPSILHNLLQKNKAKGRKLKGRATEFP